MFVGRDFYAADDCGGGGNLAPRADGGTNLERLGAFDQRGDQLDGDRGRDSGGLDAGSVELSGCRVVFDDGAIGVFGAVEIMVVILGQRLGELVSIEAADDIGIA